jgi:hypothetical protein
MCLPCSSLRRQGAWLCILWTFVDVDGTCTLWNLKYELYVYIKEKKTLYKRGVTPLFRHLIIPTPLDPTAHCSDAPLIRQSVVPTPHWFVSPLFRRPIDSSVRCSDAPLIRQSVVPTFPSINTYTTLKRHLNTDKMSWLFLTSNEMYCGCVQDNNNILTSNEMYCGCVQDNNNILTSNEMYCGCVQDNNNILTSNEMYCGCVQDNNNILTNTYLTIRGFRWIHDPVL